MESFVNWYKTKSKDQCESDSPYYEDLYGPLSRQAFTEDDGDWESDSQLDDFYQQCSRWSDGMPDYFYEFAKIVDKTGF